MTAPSRQSYKITLLRDALQRGTWPFLRQAWLILADRLFREKELVFRLDARDVPKGQIDLPGDLQFREVMAWEDLPSDFRARVSDRSSDLEWNGRDWFGKRRLWVGTRDGAVAVLGWWCDAAEAAAHFFPIPHDAELFLHAVTLPEYRGQNLHMLLRATCMQARVNHGTSAFYVHCRDYNTRSLRTIEKLGFKRIGHGIEWRIFRRKWWRFDPPNGHIHPHEHSLPNGMQAHE